MTNKSLIKVHNVETNEVYEREMTAAELKQLEADQVEDSKVALIKQKLQADKEAAQAKLTALGLTVDDLKALGL